MAIFAVLKAMAWGTKSYPLVSGIEEKQIAASCIGAAAGKVCRLVENKRPEGKRVVRISVEVVRISGRNGASSGEKEG